jgi:hypothetical protein
MGLISGVMGLLFGGSRNVVVETAEVFRENAEAAAQRASHAHSGAMRQFAAEFAVPRRGLFDRFMDGLNRLPRPMMALGTLGLFVAAMVDPIWFASRMQGIALVPEPLWWLLGAIVSFYFGARHQAKGQEFRRSVAETMAQAGAVADNVQALEGLARGAEAPAPSREANAALDEWRTARG